MAVLTLLDGSDEGLFEKDGLSLGYIEGINEELGLPLGVLDGLIRKMTREHEAAKNNSYSMCERCYLQHLINSDCN